MADVLRHKNQHDDMVQKKDTKAYVSIVIFNTAYTRECSTS